MDSRSKLARALLGGALVLLTVSVGLTAGMAHAGGATRLKKPGPPTALSLHTVGYEISASWSPPISDGGTAITSYVVSATVRRSTGSSACEYMTSPTSCIVGATSTPRVYRVNIRAYAVNSVGRGTAAKGTVFTSASPDCTYTGPWANVANCNLAGTDLAGLNLESIWMRGANLTGADLSGDNLHGLEANPVTLTNANLTNADILGNLAGSDLADADLAGATMEAEVDGVNFTGANFTNANTGGTIEDAGFGATVTDAIWDNTICPDLTNSNSDGGTCVGHGF